MKATIEFKRKENEPLEIALGGEMTIASASEMKQKLGKVIGENQITILNVSELKTIDLSGIQLLLALKGEVKKRNQKLVVTPFNEEITTVLKKTGLFELIQG